MSDATTSTSSWIGWVWVKCTSLFLVLNVLFYHFVMDDPLRRNVDTTVLSPRNYEHHNLLMDDHVQERIKVTNSSQYTWLGNQWVPPPGIPFFTPKQIKEYYSHRNILVIGDSTSRRLYITLYAILNATNLDDIPLKEIDHEECKRKNCCDADDLRDRYIGMFTPPKVMSDTYYICRNTAVGVENTNDTVGANVTYFRFDHTYQSCYAFDEYLWRDSEKESNASLNENLAGFSKDYDLVIIANGLWELAAKEHCDEQAPPGTTTHQRLQRTLDNLERNNPDGLQVVFRTSGWSTKYEHDDSIIRNANAEARQYFYDLDQRSELGRYQNNLTLVDWGGVIDHRSYKDKRIKGDSSVHYGVEARLLFIQQLTHELVKSDLIARDVENRRKDESTSETLLGNAEH